jgi:hypothetical protein
MELVSIVVAIVVAGVVAKLYSRTSQLRRRLRGAHGFTLADIPEDTFGRVTGRVRELDGALTSPLFGRRCVYYVVEVQLERDGVPSIIAGEVASVPFVLDDGTARAIIDPRSAEVAIDLQREEHGMWGSTHGLRRDFLLRAGRGEVVDVDELWFRETAIEVGETVSVLGAGVREPDPQAAPVGGYRGEVPTRLRLTSSDAYRLVIGRAR